VWGAPIAADCALVAELKMVCLYSVFIYVKRHPKPYMTGRVFGVRPLNGVMFAHEFELISCDIIATVKNKNWVISWVFSFAGCEEDPWASGAFDGSNFFKDCGIQGSVYVPFRVVRWGDSWPCKSLC
jgi:hypothetical protein